MLEYKVLYSGPSKKGPLKDRFTGGITDMVNKHIQEGWQPIGGISTNTTGLGGGAFCQAMVRDNEQIKKTNKI